MTIKDWKKAFKQLKHKPVKLKKYIKHNKPKERSTGQNKSTCSRCGQHRGHNNKYGLDLCRQCFREIAEDIGFKRYN